ncbi:MAG: GNAT family N-acetyltransferase [Phycisphaerales bacterium]|nr:GNAT family N-acetyltransferase [Phycisphaerales bacterium]MCB9854257.1 GNAT family N-acetyltransferase [Phycisphaerales bacterium]MCB9864735.1 GNAT family N-acetyltransferase [Phycisphaerales bacterium]
MKTYRQGPETNRIKLRSMTADDAGAFFALNSHPDVMRYTGEQPLKSVEEARSAIERYPDFDTYGYGRWACVLKETQAVIGFCGLKYLEDLEAVDLGYRFLPEYWGQGLATEASHASVRFGFETLNLDRIIGLVLPDNTASIRVLEKVGMRLDGEITLDGQQALQYSVRRPS